ncbi:MAG: hypothetical protein IKM39_03635 [Clostridia bacterium]|nr:hypothetical protein [Clostridia bacterium]
MKRFLGLVLVLTLVLSLASVGLVSAEDATVGEGTYGTDWAYYGDVDMDKAKDAKDALAVLRYAVRKIEFSQTQEIVADVTKDTVIDAKDALDILKFSVGKIITFTAGVFYQITQVEPEPDVPVLDTTNSFNGAYEADESADTNFVIDNTGLKTDVVYVIQKGVFEINKDKDDKEGQLENKNMQRLVVSLQGLVNRDFGKDENHRSIIYMTSDESDSAWLNEMLKDGVYEGFEKYPVTNADAFFSIFEHQLKYCGMILWDRAVGATANVAGTICGLDGYLPVLGGSQLETKLKALGVPVKLNLIDMFKNNQKGQRIIGTNMESTGSAKNDAYLWALEKYFHRCSSKYIAYILDGGISLPENNYKNAGMDGLNNHDYLIARRCFFYDLNPYTDDIACDDPSGIAGLDGQTLRAILQRRYDRANGDIGMNMGFPPWWAKYNASYGGGRYSKDLLEPYFAELVTCYNLAMEADAANLDQMTNGSAYYKYVPVLSKFENTKPATEMKYDNSKYYFTVYVGDYDSSAWMKQYVYSMWIRKDRKLGKVNLMWSYNPNLSYRIPMAFDYVYRNKSDKDYFAAGDSGAGYVNPTALFPNITLAQSLQPRPASTGDGSSKWVEYCQKFYKQFDLDITGFIINTGNPFDKKVMDMYNQISPVGSLYYNGNDERLLINNGVPYLQCRIGVGKGATEYLYDWAMNSMNGYHFAAYRTVSWTPSEIASTVDGYIAYAAGKGTTVEYVDPYNLFSMIKQSGQGHVVK